MNINLSRSISEKEIKSVQVATEESERSTEAELVQLGKRLV